MAKPKAVFGRTQNNIPLVTLEGGPKTAMLWTGGPGNALPKGFLLNSFLK